MRRKTAATSLADATPRPDPEWNVYADWGEGEIWDENTRHLCVRMYVRAEDGLGAGEPCDVACADEIWKALVELGSPSTVLSCCISCFSSFELPPMPGSRLIVAAFEMPCAAAHSASP